MQRSAANYVALMLELYLIYGSRRLTRLLGFRYTFFVQQLFMKGFPSHPVDIYAQFTPTMKSILAASKGILRHDDGPAVVRRHHLAALAIFLVVQLMPRLYNGVAYKLSNGRAAPAPEPGPAPIPAAALLSSLSVAIRAAHDTRVFSFSILDGFWEVLGVAAERKSGKLALRVRALISMDILETFGYDALHKELCERVPVGERDRLLLRTANDPPHPFTAEALIEGVNPSYRSSQAVGGVLEAYERDVAPDFVSASSALAPKLPAFFLPFFVLFSSEGRARLVSSRSLEATGVHREGWVHANVDGNIAKAPLLLLGALLGARDAAREGGGGGGM
jgi:hypothetical protein